jgi:Nickel responsive protein SCO4226-like
MKHLFTIVLLFAVWAMSSPLKAQQSTSGLTSVKGQGSSANIHTGKKLYLDVHNVGPGKLTYEAVAQAHAKDLATEGLYGVEFIKFWVDTAKGTVYCLALAYDSASIVHTHAKAHGLLPDRVYAVSAGDEAAAKGGNNLYLDFHELGAGNVKASDVAAAHQKDLAVEKKYGVNLINYWVDEKEGVVMCLAEAPDSNALIMTHKEAHGLLPKYVKEVRQGQ